MESIHAPVLLQEIIAYCDPKPGKRFIDATANGGGHTFALWDRVQPTGTVLALDKDKDLIQSLAEKAKGAHARILTVHAGYAELPRVIQETHMEGVDGIIFDLGYSSWHIDKAGRGFTFKKDEPLDMRYDTTRGGATAEDIVNGLPENELADMIYTYGEDTFSRQIAKTIVLARKKERITTSVQLAQVVSDAVPKRFWGKIHPATKTFQALRIYVNQELSDLEKALPFALAALKKGGVLAVISFHSLEDRIVKQYLKSQEKEGTLEIQTKKPIRPSFSEGQENPRSRSAKLRVAHKQ